MWSIRRKVLQMVLEASKDCYPNEFGAFLKAENEIIYEIAILPGTIFGDRHTIFQMWNKPIDLSIIGSIHSHPSGVCLPSDADRTMFSNTGALHIIVGYPYGLTNYNAFNRKSEKVSINLL